MRNFACFVYFVGVVLLAFSGCLDKSKPQVNRAGSPSSSGSQQTKLGLLLAPTVAADQRCFYGITRTVDFAKANVTLASQTTAQGYVAFLLKNSKRISAKSVKISALVQALNTATGGVSSVSNLALADTPTQWDALERIGKGTIISGLNIAGMAVWGIPEAGAAWTASNKVAAGGAGFGYFNGLEMAAQGAWDLGKIRANKAADEQTKQDTQTEAEKTEAFNKMLEEKKQNSADATGSQQEDVGDGGSVPTQSDEGIEELVTEPYQDQSGEQMLRLSDQAPANGSPVLSTKTTAAFLKLLSRIPSDPSSELVCP